MRKQKRRHERETQEKEREAEEKEKRKDQHALSRAFLLPLPSLPPSSSPGRAFLDLLIPRQKTHSQRPV